MGATRTAMRSLLNRAAASQYRVQGSSAAPTSLARHLSYLSVAHAGRSRGGLTGPALESWAPISPHGIQSRALGSWLGRGQAAAALPPPQLQPPAEPSPPPPSEEAGQQVLTAATQATDAVAAAAGSLSEVGSIAHESNAAIAGLQSCIEYIHIQAGLPWCAHFMILDPK